VTTYHRSTDEIEIPAFLSEHGYECRFSKGYVLALFIDRRPPSFRRCLVFANKTKNVGSTYAQ